MRENHCVSVFLIAALLFAWASTANAAICTASLCYVTQAGGSGARDGTDWTKALSAADLVSGMNEGQPSSRLTRGSTYYIANGNFGSIAFDDPVANNAWIKIFKATQSNSGNVAGWNSAFGGQAVFSLIVFATNYVEFNGQVRDEQNWSDGTKYGFRVTAYVKVHGDNYRQDDGRFPRTEGGNYITIKYVDIGYPQGSTYSSSMGKGVGVFPGPSGGNHDYIITNNYIHHTREPVHFTGNGYNILVDRNYIGPSWGKETVMAYSGGHHFIVSNNIMVDNCQSVPDDSSAKGCTTEVSGWSNESGDNYDYWQVFGNVIFRKNVKVNNYTNAIVWGGGGSSVTGWRVYNNVFAGIHSVGTKQITISITGTGNKVYNNLWYDIGPDSIVGCNIDEGSECANNWCYTGSNTQCNALGTNSVVGDSDPFNGYLVGDFSLKTNSSAKNAGRNLSADPEFSAGRVDFLDRVRGADGSWDIGALEQSSEGANPAPAAPSSLRIQ